jgi:signal transduction histidine kinase
MAMLMRPTPRPTRRVGRGAEAGRSTVRRADPPNVSVPISLNRSLIEAHEVERRRIARDLHDVVGQALTMVKLSLIAIRSDDPAAGRIQESLSVIDNALTVVRTFALDLRPAALDDLGLEAAIRSHLGRVGRDAGLQTALISDPRPLILEPEVEIHCFRMFQEAMTNVVRHANASHVTVLLRQRRARLQLIVRDDGAGFDPTAALAGIERGETLGLAGMSERAGLLNGSVRVRSAIGRGTEIVISVPALVYRPATLDDAS